MLREPSAKQAPRTDPGLGEAAGSIRALFVGDDAAEHRRVCDLVANSPYGPFAIDHVDRFEEAVRRLAADTHDVVLVDFGLFDGRGFDGFLTLKERAGDRVVVVLTESRDPALALRVMRAGAQDCLWKAELSDTVLPRTLRHAVERGRSERRFKTVFDSSPNGIVITSVVDGQVLAANQAFLASLGYTRDEVLGRTAQDLGWWTSPAERTAYARDVAAGRIVAGRDHRLLTKDGEERTVLMSGQLVEFAGVPCILTTGTDITERVRADRRLRLTRFALDRSAEAVCWIAEDGCVEEANRAACDALGYPRDELLGMRVADFDPTLAELGAELLARPDESGSLRLESRYRRKDGTFLPVEIVGSRVSGEGSDHLVVLARDASERKAAEEQLGASERRFRTMFEYAPVPCFLTDLSGRFLDGNRAAEEITGYTRAELAGRTFKGSSLLDRGQLSAAGRTLALGALGEGSGPREFRLKRKDGTDVLLEVRALPIELDGRHVLIAIGHDVTERKRAEEALRESEERYRGLVEHAVYGIYRSSLHGRFLWVNRALVDMLGYDSAEDLLRLDMAQEVYADPDQRDALIERFQGAELIDSQEVRWKRRDGRQIAVRQVGRPVYDTRGELEGFEVIVEDVTDRRRLEGQLRQAQKMEAIGQLTGGIAHDFNNLLSVILVSGELMRAGLERGEPVSLAELDHIQAAARRAADVTRQLLGFSRRADLRMAHLDLGELVLGFTGMMRRVIPEHVEMVVSVPDSAMTVRGDATAIEQVLLNLATNARDAMPDGGRLTITVEERSVDPSYAGADPDVPPGRYASVSMSDTGEGMTADVRARYFEPFFTTKSRDLGTGLGGAMVYGLVRQHRGLVNVYSEPGRGTTVRVMLPMAEGAAEDAMAEARWDDAPVEGTTILLVEDEPSLRTVSAKALEGHGYTVLSAADGHEAMRLFHEERERIDLVVSDLIMPGMGGAELFRSLRDLSPQLPFLMVSGYGSQDGEPEVPMLQKPWTVTELLGRVREVLGAEGGRAT